MSLFRRPRIVTTSGRETPGRRGAALAGVVAGGLALALTELVAGGARRVPSLVGAVGDAVVDWLPQAVVRFGIETFGASDKAVLVTVVLILCALASAPLGRAGARDFRRAVAGFGAFGLVGALTALRDPQAAGVPVVASTTLAVAMGLAALAVLLRLAPRYAPSPPPQVLVQPIGVPERRRFLAAAGVLAGGAVVFASGGRRLFGSGRLP